MRTGFELTVLHIADNNHFHAKGVLSPVFLAKASTESNRNGFFRFGGGFLTKIALKIKYFL